jgi:hypothetical protein
VGEAGPEEGEEEGEPLMPSVLSVTPIEAIRLAPFSDAGCEYYTDNAAGTQRFCYSEGDLSDKRKLVWARDDRGDTYIRCSSCRKILRMTIAYNLIIGHHLYSVNCEHCSTNNKPPGCGRHTWVVLKNWVQRRLRGSIKFRPNTCPACTSKNTFSENYSGFRCCRDCLVRWKLTT